jgi:hypothetical protein
VEAIAARQGITADTQTWSRPQFTPMRFVNTLAEFIVATDQVYILFYFSDFYFN